MSRNKEVLLVHDDQESPAARRHLFEMAGYRVSLVQSALACLQSIERRRPALVWSDVLVHGMTGFELCRRIRAQHEPEALPVVLSSYVYCLPLFREEALAAGAQEYVVKPAPPDELLHVLQRFASRVAATA
jgi:CheY-like chemotaxis protein